MKNHKLSSILIFLLVSFLLPLPVKAGAPTEQVRGTVDKVLTILQDPGLKSKDKTKERRQQLRQVISARFDFAEMAKRSLGQQWGRRTAEEQAEFVKLFTDLLEDAYVSKMESYNGEKVLYTGEKPDNDSVEVDTKVATKKGEEYSINYKLHQSKGEWKVYDVVIENISLVNNYRSQFNRILANSSYNDLVQRIKEKQLNAAGTKGKS
jgi:phospholipid transport system substrate-binding protein